jgi:hypothetical protein
MRAVMGPGHRRWLIVVVVARGRGIPLMCAVFAEGTPSRIALRTRPTLADLSGCSRNPLRVREVTATAGR